MDVPGDAPWDDWASGFRIGDAWHPWGTCFETIAPGRVDRGYATVELPCSTAYGFTTIYAEPTAPRPDRPVTTVAYELADTGEPSKYIFAQLVVRLGPPQQVSRSDVADGANSCDSVVLHASWRCDEAVIRLSLYGAPRPSAFGEGVGKLYLSWNDARAAAAPFLAEWSKASQALEQAAADAKPEVFPVRYPIYEAGTAPPLPRELALSSPELLRTPPTIAARLEPTTFALWSDSAGKRWHLSTVRSTVVLGGPDSSMVQLLEIAPAKGGGFSGLEVGQWHVRDIYQSRSIAEAARALAKVPGVKIEHVTGYDA